MSPTNAPRRPIWSGLPTQAGDILPAIEAIDAIPSTDLDPPIEIPPIPVDAYKENIFDEEREFLRREIKRLSLERNALILAHNYQTEDVQKVAHKIGDSLYLARMGVESNASVIVEAAVLFMNQILAAKKKPNQIVLAPSLDALCSLAAHAKVDKILDWKKDYPDGIVVSYVNTYLDVKAISDYCCASGNAAKVIEYVIERHPDQQVLFLPDVYLGLYAAKLLLKLGKSIDNIWLMMGACHVHDRIRPHHVAELREKYPDAGVVIHPECGCNSCLRQVSDSKPEELNEFKSTWGMIEHVKNAPQKRFIVATEVGNIIPMSIAAPDKEFIPANPNAVCAFMKQNTLRKVYESLRDLKYEITVDPELAKKAQIPIDRMLAIL